MYITKKQKQVLEFIASYIEAQGIAPTYEEIADHFGYRSKGTVHKHITNLEEKGYLKKDWNRSRGLEVLRNPFKSSESELPLRGRVAAGEPIEAVEDSELIAVPSDMIGNGEHYVLQVRGDSMIEENIQDGDYVIVQPRQTAENGDMVIALVDEDEATLKKFYRENGTVRLQPANQTMEPILLSADRVRIRGLVIGVMRKYT
ncbi:MAG: transcriptional repressor LexA [Candidatus Marinimicrobia bacterium]|nr:transcriptional repressor LexA [Candidatus Neomarinimicrobiota bacterium]MCF7829114.1 transcriptional repressor LexA [Candidatus Neomarinimicrobiota bacterium]MCF7881487.1 transcriptional repressor LexA [Candidatus Neomarinimicrobiota bacterium]